MADYYFPTVVQQIIPNADMTPLERLILTHMPDSQPDGDGLYFFSEDGPRDFIEVPAAELKAALERSARIKSRLRNYIAKHMASFEQSGADVEIDLTGTAWEFFLQDIVQRSSTLLYVTVVTAFTCSKMHPDGFGGMAVLISANTIKGKSTSEILEDFIAQLEETQTAPASQ